MKKALLAFGMLLMTAPAHADITSRMSTSIQLTVDGAASQATRLGSSYSVTGSNITASTLGGLTAPASATAAGTMSAGSYAQTTDGDAFSFSESFNQGDAIPSNTTVTSGVVPSLPAFGSVTTNSGGVAGNLAGSIDSAGTMSITAGGAGTSATGQFVTEIFVR
jgi:hypothetical protein|tara:strand:+ start:667 stop:1158 length:492 start_codon:yes stop_codon:yes gene_type:complete